MENWPKNVINREARFAGQFYPGNKNELNNKLTSLFEDAAIYAEKTTQKLDRNNKLQAIISPHAGYVFSGKVAASAYSLIPEKQSYKRVFVLASSHRYLLKGAAVYTRGNYETPLGEVKVDTTLSKVLVNSNEWFEDNVDVHKFEHSLEVQLPFLQHKLGDDFQLVPIILGTQNPETCINIAAGLKPYFNDENLFVISTDFSHYPNYIDAKLIDGITANAICTNKANELNTVLSENKMKEIRNLSTSLCGWTSVLSLLHLTENQNFFFEKIRYQNSGDAEHYGEKERVVGYWAIAVFAHQKPFVFSEEEKMEILGIARDSIKTFLKTGNQGGFITTKNSGILNEKTGVFVSIYIDKELRGCIGSFAREETLNELVQKMAVSAIRDRRFKSVEYRELDKMELEISVLSPLNEIKSVNEIELGKHGVLIRKGMVSGTFLPQVAKKTGWNVEQFLGHCSHDKAGIGWEGWKTAEIFTFEAIIFRENEIDSI